MLERQKITPDLFGLWRYFKDPKTNWRPKALVFLALIYTIWPIDLIPDLAPIIGWLDDLGLAALSVWYLIRSSKKYLSK